MGVNLLLSNWERIRTKLIETIECFEEEDLDYSPAENQWTVREIMLHIAHEEMIEVVYGTVQKIKEWPQEYPPHDYQNIESIKAVLDEVHSQSVDYLGSIEDADLGRTIMAPWGREFILGEMVGHTMEHEAHHRGELSMILGILGRQAPDI